MSLSICHLDVLPPKCSLEAEWDGGRVRFRATDRTGQHSLWSGWFELADAPVALSWCAFEWPDGS
jgi:hypothetical protein